MSRFCAMAKMELRKALGANAWFWVTVGVGTFLALYAAAVSSEIFANTLDLALRHWDTSESLYSATSCFTFWIAISKGGFASGIFRLTWPLLAALPYAWSWNSEHRSGMLEQQFARASRVVCCGAKALATFVAGALAVSVPLVVNLLACACFAPASPVWISDVLYVGVSTDAALSSLFFTNPLAFCVAWTLVVALLAGLWSTAVSALSMLLGSFLETLVASYLFLHVLAYVGSQLQVILSGALGDGAHSALLLLDVFSAASVWSVPHAGLALLATLAVLLVISVVLPAVLLGRDEL